MPDNTSLAALLARYSYREGDFVLSSGARSTFYLDAKQVTYRAEGVAAVGAAMLPILKEFDVEAVGGLTMGADAIVMNTVWASLRTDRPVSGFVVRKEAKGHGTRRRIEGVHPEGKRVAIVDDVITTAGSALNAVEEVRAAGGNVVVVVGLVDREEGGAQVVERAGLPFRALCTLTEIRQSRARPAAGA